MDGIIDEDDKFLRVLVRHVDKDSGLIVTSLLDMPNINRGSTAHQMYDVCNEVREALFITYSPDNANPMIVQRNNLLQNIRKAQNF